MTGTLVVVAEERSFGRAGNIVVKIDGAKVGKVRQGSSDKFAVEPGTHTVRVSQQGTRSRAVTVDVRDDGRHAVTASTKSGVLSIAFVVPILGLLLAQIPGSYIRLTSNDH